jgi:hypothetical protein
LQEIDISKKIQKRHWADEAKGLNGTGKRKRKAKGTAVKKKLSKT